MKLSKVLKLYTSKDVEDFIVNNFSDIIRKKALLSNDVTNNWKVLGGNYSNVSNINLLTKGEKGIIERITNAIDAVIEKQKEVNNIINASDSLKIIQKAFPKYYKNYIDIINDNSDRNQAYDIDDYVKLVINDGSTSFRPTFDIIDRGTGVSKNEFKSTLLSLNQGNKLSSKKNYLIGAFGQGGSTSLPFSEYTIIISKKNNKYSMTIITSLNIEDYKNAPYFYLVNNDEPIELEDDSNKVDRYLENFISSESGTLIRMIDTDISSELRGNDITKPGQLIDYINTELFDVKVPIKIVENRLRNSENLRKQDRNAYGSYLKLKTAKKNIKKEYSGQLDFSFKDKSYKIEYYVILPSNEDDWSVDIKAKETMMQYNTYCDPILFTVNGQTITTEKFTKIKNKGLYFLKYRLLIIINLDILGNEKYKFFTSDRAKIKANEDTKGLVDAVIDKITKVEDLKIINDILSKKSISKVIDNELLENISNKVKNKYNDFLKLKDHYAVKLNTKIKSEIPNKEEFLYENSIQHLKLSPDNKTFYNDDEVLFTLNTGANKVVNSNTVFDCYIDNKSYSLFERNNLNGRVQFTFKPGDIEKGEHSVYISIFDNNKFNYEESNVINFRILDINNPSTNIINKKNNILDLEIKTVNDSESICDLIKNDNKLLLTLCLEHELLKKDIYGGFKDSTEIQLFQNNIIEPISLFALYSDEMLEKLDVLEKNMIILNLIKSTLNIIQIKNF